MARRRRTAPGLLAGFVVAACSLAPGPSDRVAAGLAFVTEPTASYKVTPIPGPVRVAVVDGNGEIVVGSRADVTIALGANPAGATLTGMTTAEAVNGVATFPTLAISAPGVGFTLTASSAGLTGVTSADFTVIDPIPTSVAFQNQITASIKDSLLQGGPIQVALLDGNGDVFPEAFAIIQISIGTNPGGATLSGLALAATVDGVATFTNLKLSEVGAGYTLVATATNLPTGTSNPFDVTLSFADVDGDGFSPYGGDCNDLNPNIRPGVSDFPDGLFVDMNCDGIDGEVNNAVFVAQAGTDNGTCGTMAVPCRTINFGMQRAATLGKRDVYLKQGAYKEPVKLVNGVSLYGGYDELCPPRGCIQWQRAAGRTSEIDGEFVADSVDIGVGEPQAVTLFGENLTTPATIADIRIYAILRIGTNLTVAGGRGRSTYAVILRNVPAGVLTFDRVGFVGTAAYWGIDGVNGGDAPGTPATNGAVGGNGGTPADCDDSSRGTAGAGGSSEIANANGGAGGRGGAKDTDCSAGTLNLSAQAGESGANADAFQLGVFGSGGAFGPGAEGPCTVGPGNGLPGRIVNGGAGASIGARGFLENGLWVGFDGQSGGLGQDGTGGGGGGGAGGCGEGADAYGPGGGGGGAGGARAIAQSAGGRSAGGSFGLYLINASPTLINSSVSRAAGGKGGVGGIGGRGQSGGVGGAGGTQGLRSGGRGANGAHGGHGAGGGGGAGGISVGIFRSSSASVPVLSSVVFFVGAGGDGGAGGLSAPTAPPGERDGVAGLAGPSGGTFDIFLCANPSGC
ncbi:MAG TPA: hypothetical protein VJR92_06015 [Gemmatimonadaceae bacterium]|nr:hypothetical protein [Gemmatimonadaceae bacterium]